MENNNYINQGNVIRAITFDEECEVVKLFRKITKEEEDE